MKKPATPKPSTRLMRQLFKRESPKKIAADLGVSLSLVYHWADPKAKNTNAHPLVQVKKLLKSTGGASEIVGWLLE